LAALMASLVEQAEAARQSSNLGWSVDIDPYESL